MKQRQILDMFIDAGYIKGKYTREVRLGPMIRKILKYRNITEYTYQTAKATLEKRIDAICTTENEIWILEVKNKLNPASLGQVLTYAEIYPKFYKTDGKKIRKGIVCLQSDPETQKVCEKYHVKVFLLT